MLSFSLQIDAAHPPSGAAEDSKKVQFSLDEAPQPIVTRIKKTLMNLDFAVKDNRRDNWVDNQVDKRVDKRGINGWITVNRVHNWLDNQMDNWVDILAG